MKKMTSAEIRQAFLDYFNEQSHEIVDSSPLPNYDNPTLLFTNAGMNQFADVFLGKEARPYNRAVTAQKVMRVSGKHNDLENVGPSLRHHTFFEMLGNFSFGDYFKTEAIEYAWKFLTEVIELPAERLFVSIYLDDDEAFELWQKWIPAAKILRFGKEDNYWEMGDVGPNGPCSEIHYYQGDLDHVDTSLLNNDDDTAETFVEIWNLVFMQFETDANGVKTPLPKPSIDTGMGMERLVRILQGGANNYDTDLFSGALDKVQVLLGDSDVQRAEKIVGYRVIADHGRAATFLIGDGVIPGNSAEKYVLRMIIRRAARFGRKIGFTQPFLAEIAQLYIEEMGAAYPDLVRQADFIQNTITLEEKRFARTLDSALVHLDRIAADLKTAGQTEIPGDVAFDLHATYGLPIEITRDLAAENGLTVDDGGFAIAKAAHAKVSGGALGQYEVGENVYADALKQLIENGTLDASGVDYDPYNEPTAAAHVIGIFSEGAIIETAVPDTPIELITEATPFYVESGGEVSDTGTITTATGTMIVTDTKKPVPGLIVHLGVVKTGVMNTGDVATLQVDDVRRGNIRRNHTATHILHKELREKLGTHVTQQGSLVAPGRLRFDFSHGEAVDAAVLAEIEQKINTAILANYGVAAASMGKEDAIKMGAMALFGEKYGDVVRTIQIGDSGGYSFELCGGLHVLSTGEIGSFHFVNESSVAAGVRRVEAVTGAAAQQYVTEQMGLLDQSAAQLNVKAAELPSKIDALVAENKRLQKEIAQLKRGSAKEQFDTLIETMQTVSGVALLVAQVDGVDVDGLREMTDWFRNRVPSGVAVLATINNDKPLFIATVTEDVIKQGIKAGDLVREMGKMTGGGGGGRPNLAQAGGRDASKLGAALAAVPDIIAQKIANTV